MADDVDDQPQHPGVMLALVPPAEVSELLALEGGEPLDEQHVTLFYLGEADDLGEGARDRLEGMAMRFAAGRPPVVGHVGGLGVFTPSPGSDGQHVLVALWDIPGGAELRFRLGEALDGAGVTRGPGDHGFQPHQTLLYSEQPVEQLPELHPEVLKDVEFGSLVVVWRGEWQHFPLGG